MKKTVFLIAMAVIGSNQLNAQNLEAFMSLDTQIGGTSNTFLNPFINEWDRAADAGYAMVSPSVQLYWKQNRFTGDLSAGYVFEPFFDERTNWSGYYGTSNVRYRISPQFLAGVEVGGSRFTSTFNRGLISVLPEVTWSPTFFTRIRFRGGSTFRHYQNFEQENADDFNDRLDLYGIEAEFWPSFNWQLRTGMFGNFDENLIENNTIYASVVRVFQNSLRFSLHLAVDQYKNKFTTTIQTEGGGMPPTGRPGGPPDDAVEEIVVEETNRLLRGGASVSYTLFNSLTATGRISNVNFFPAEQDNLTDLQASVGLRYTLPVSKSGLFRDRQINPRWNKEKDGAVYVTLNYRGEGDLFLVGEFNDWDRPGLPLSRQTNQRHAVQIELEPGIYEYKILMVKDGEEKWIELGDDAMTVNDGFGGENGLIFIE